MFMFSIPEQMRMKNLVTDETFSFKVNRWMSRNEEDKDVWRELPVVSPGKQPLPGTDDVTSLKLSVLLYASLLILVHAMCVYVICSAAVRGGGVHRK